MPEEFRGRDENRGRDLNDHMKDRPEHSSQRTLRGSLEHRKGCLHGRRKFEGLQKKRRPPKKINLKNRNPNWASFASEVNPLEN